MSCTSLGSANHIDYDLHNTQPIQLYMVTLVGTIKGGFFNKKNEPDTISSRNVTLPVLGGL